MYKLNETEMFYDMADGQAVVINFSSGAYYGTNLLGSEVLDRILKGYAIDKILLALKKAPGCPEDIETKLNAFVNELKNKRIITEGEVISGGDEPFADSVFAEGFDMDVTEYKEVQDLILADPIHEVEEDAGWPVKKD